MFYRRGCRKRWGRQRRCIPHLYAYRGVCIARVRKDNLQKGGRKAMDGQVEAVHYVYTCSHRCMYLSVDVKIV